MAAGVGRRGPVHRASDDPDDPRPRFYALDMFPYPSGDLHMGHAEAFSGGDAVARFRAHAGLQRAAPDRVGRVRAAGRERGDQARRSTRRSGRTRTSSSRRRRSAAWACRSTGRRRLHTCDPEYYRWTQWLFLRFFEQGLAYRKNAPVNWCPNDQTVLANEQVINGRVRAVRHAGGAPGPDAVVLQDHRLRAAAARRHGGRSRMAGARDHDAAQLDRALRGRRGHVHDRRDRRRGRRSSRPAPTRCGASRSSCSRSSIRWSSELAELGGTSDEVEPLLEQAADHAADRSASRPTPGRASSWACTP